MENLIAVWTQIKFVMASQFSKLTSTLVTPTERLFWFYICTSLLIAYLIYRRRNGPPDLKGFFGFVFPSKVWSNPSAWLDVRYFIVNHFIGKLFYIGLTASMAELAFRLVSGGSLLSEITSQGMPTGAEFFVALGFMVVTFAIADFTSFFLHFLQHKIPLLWEFHKVHHSPEVMHPLSNFREHPIDNILYTSGLGLVSGVLAGLFVMYYGQMPHVPTIFAVPVFVFLFNVSGYHLRHSHVWLRWPGRWSMVFPSPAHHHVHHSRHPDHLDKNFAFFFPVWDVLFGTYHMPETDEDVEFGIYGVDEVEYTNIWLIYMLPFRKLWARMSGDRTKS